MKRQILPSFASYLGMKEEDLVCFSEDIKRLNEPSSILKGNEYNKNVKKYDQAALLQRAKGILKISIAFSGKALAISHEI